MKWILAVFFIPLLSYGQTVHLKDGRIAYEGLISTADFSVVKLHDAVEAVKKHASTHTSISWQDQDSSTDDHVFPSKMKLNSTQSVLNSLRYTLKLTREKKGYRYSIDSVSLISIERGGKTKVISSEELVKDMDNNGPVATQMEKTLNEIDMRLQQLLYLLAHYLH